MSRSGSTRATARRSRYRAASTPRSARGSWTCRSRRRRCRRPAERRRERCSCSTTPDTIRKKFKTAVTDSGREIRYAPDEKPGVSNLIEILSVASGRAIAEVEAGYDGKGYGDLKTDVGDAVVELFKPMQERYEELRGDEGELRRLLRIGADKAQSTSAPTLHQMYERMGFVTR